MIWCDFITLFFFFLFQNLDAFMYCTVEFKLMDAKRIGRALLDALLRTHPVYVILVYEFHLAANLPLFCEQCVIKQEYSTESLNPHGSFRGYATKFQDVWASWLCHSSSSSFQLKMSCFQVCNDTSNFSTWFDGPSHITSSPRSERLEQIHFCSSILVASNDLLLFRLFAHYDAAATMVCTRYSSR